MEVSWSWFTVVSIVVVVMCPAITVCRLVFCFPQLDAKTLEAFKNCFANLAIPFIAAAEPVPCESHTVILPDDSAFPGAVEDSDGDKVWKWTLWDKIDVADPTMTLQGLIDFLVRDFGATASMITHGNSILYSAYSSTAAQTKRLTTR